jgi:hypothetical protein
LHFHRHDHDLCAWAFDLLHLNGRDLRELTLIERKARLEKLIVAVNASWRHYSESFDDGIELIKVADLMKLEGIVSKHRDARLGARRTKNGCDCSSVAANYFANVTAARNLSRSEAFPLGKCRPHPKAPSYERSLLRESIHHNRTRH